MLGKTCNQMWISWYLPVGEQYKSLYIFQTLEDFFHQLDLICGTGHLEVNLRKPDKKKERYVF